MRKLLGKIKHRIAAITSKLPNWHNQLVLVSSSARVTLTSAKSSKKVFCNMLHVSDHPQLSNMFGMVFRVNLDWIYLVISSTFDFKLVLIVIISKRKEDGHRCGNVRIMPICQIICVKNLLDEIIPTIIV